MNSILYLYCTTFRNRIRQALHKPVTYVYLAIALLYLVMLPYSFRILLREWEMDSAEGMAAVFTAFAFWVIPSNLISYAKRKGMVYRLSDVHFLFPAPVGFKWILLYTFLKTLPAYLVLNFLLAAGGCYVFGVVWWKMLVYFLFSIFLENILEGSIMVLLYGSERMDQKARDILVKASYALMGVIVALGVGAYLKERLSFQAVLYFLHSDQVQMIPFVGWYAAVVHLLFLGPTKVNVACSILYFVLFACLLAAAARMRCSGEFFEDAMKFADDYEEVLSSRLQGRTDLRLGKKKKLGKAYVKYRGKGARAIFYRQLLEYKKQRFFIFDINTVVSLAAGCIISYLYLFEDGFGSFNDFIVPAAMAYVVLIFTGFSGKWGKEIRTPYTFLIPDYAFRKLVYATAMQVFQAFANAWVFVLPPALSMRLPFSTVAFTVAGYVLLYACKLYVLVVVEVAVGNVLGRVGKQFFQLFLMGLIIGFAAFGAVLGFVFGGIPAAYGLMLFVLAGMLVILLTISTLCFYRMETVNR